MRRNPGAKSVKISALIPSVEVDIIPQDARVSVFIAAYENQADIIAKNPGEFRRASQLALKIEREKFARRDDLVPPHAKVAANYTAAMTAKWRARKAGFDDVILLDEACLVTEAPTTNLFMVANGEFTTPPGNKVLLGITRNTIMALGAALDCPCVERDIAVEELTNARELFLSDTSVGVWPVASIDGKPVANGSVGPKTERLRDKYFAVVRGEEAEFEHWLHYV